MAVDKSYTSDDIQVLTDRDHVRLRTQIYAGNTKITSVNVPLFLNEGLVIKQLEFIPAVYKIVGEILDNVVDEFAQIKTKNKTLEIECDPANGVYRIADNGRGVPIDMHAAGKYTPEVVFTTMRSGRNFKAGKEVGVIGMNGVGSSMTNFMSSEFHITIHREGKKYTQSCLNGGATIKKPKIVDSASKKTGTEIKFTLDKTLFDTISLPLELIRNRATEIALTNPDVTVLFNGEKIQFKNGAEGFIKNISEQYYKFTGTNMDVYVILDVYKGIDEQIYTFVNNSLLIDGGICNTQFLNAFYDNVIDNTKTEARKLKCEVTKNDVRQDLLVLGFIKLSDPEYDSQAKTKLTGPPLRKEFLQMIGEQWKAFQRRNKTWLEKVVNVAAHRHSYDSTNKLAKDLAKQNGNKIPGLLDATSKVRFDCKLFVTEGDSAAGAIADVRDAKTIASLPLTGKINNVFGENVSSLSKMPKIINLINAIGLIPGKKIERSQLRYGKIIIATDADVDGGDIFSLLVNLFYQFWPDMFDPRYEPIVHRLIVPNVVASKGTQRIHFPSMDEFIVNESKYKTGWEIEYFKGLGSQQLVDWQMIMADIDKYLIPVVDDGNLAATLELLFSPDVLKRKEWLS